MFSSSFFWQASRLLNLRRQSCNEVDSRPRQNYQDPTHLCRSAIRVWPWVLRVSFRPPPNHLLTKNIQRLIKWKVSSEKNPKVHKRNRNKKSSQITSRARHFRYLLILPLTKKVFLDFQQVHLIGSGVFEQDWCRNVIGIWKKIH